MIVKRVFLQWFALALTFATMAFFAYEYQIVQDVWKYDVTHITSVISLSFVATVVYLGFASWRYDANDCATAIADVGIGRMAGYAVTLLGLLGTIIGLSVLLGSVDVTDPQHAAKSIAIILQAIRTALYCTGTGIVASIGISLMNANIEYFADLDEADTK